LDTRQISPYIQSSALIGVTVAGAVYLGTEAAGYLLSVLVPLTTLLGAVISKRTDPEGKRPTGLVLLIPLALVACGLILVELLEPKRSYVVIPSLLLVSLGSCYVLGTFLKIRNPGP